jgi:hypothetical protein
MRQLAPVLVGIAVAVVLAAGAARAELTGPAELPPAGYAGQQYVDSRGCLFMRAGTPGNVLWLPRVTRSGEQLCGNPPSGRRVPVAEEGAASPAPADSAPAPAPSVADRAIYVAVGSFGVAGNVSRAEERLRALGFPAARGQPRAGSLTTVYAGPFQSVAAAEAARATLRTSGFPDAILVGN